MDRAKAKEKHAVVLSGGGAFGAFHIGVLRALVNGTSSATNRRPLEPEIFTGTSVGAYNAAVLVSKAELDARASVAHLQDLWLDRIAGGLADNGVMCLRDYPIPMLLPRHLVRARHWLRPAFGASLDAAQLSYKAGCCLTHFLARSLVRPTIRTLDLSASYLSHETQCLLAYFMGSTRLLMRRTVGTLDLGTFISMEPLHKLVRETISLEKMRKSNRTLKIATTNWLTGELRTFVHDPAKAGEWKEGEEESFTEESWPHALIASTAIPGVFPAIKIDGAAHVDGGVVMNTPLKPAIRAGATVVHLISLNADARNIRLDGGPENTTNLFERFLNLMVSAAADDDVKRAESINKSLEEKSPPRTPRRKDGDPYRGITIHRYSPKTHLGGPMGMLDFRVERLRDRMKAGEMAARAHNCEIEGCVIPIPEQVHPANRLAS